MLNPPEITDQRPCCLINLRDFLPKRAYATPKPTHAKRRLNRLGALFLVSLVLLPPQGRPSRFLTVPGSSSTGVPQHIAPLLLLFRVGLQSSMFPRPADR